MKSVPATRTSVFRHTNMSFLKARMDAEVSVIGVDGITGNDIQ